MPKRKFPKNGYPEEFFVIHKNLPITYNVVKETVLTVEKKPCKLGLS